MGIVDVTGDSAGAGILCGGLRSSVYSINRDIEEVVTVLGKVTANRSGVASMDC